MEAIFYGACGVENCSACHPTYDLNNNVITDDDGYPLGGHS